MFHFLRLETQRKGMVIIMKKILPLADPMIVTYPCIANPLSIIQLLPQANEWIYSNFLALSARYQKQENKFGIYLCNGSFLWTDIYIWKNCPYLNFYRMERRIFKRYSIDIVPFIIDCIKRNQYVYMYIRQSDIDEYKCNDPELSHDIMIFGYNSRKHTFYARDYFDRHYSTKEVRQEHVKLAFQHCSSSTCIDRFEGVISFSLPTTFEANRNLKIYENMSPQKRYLHHYLECLEEFLGSRINSEKLLEREDYFYGIHIFDALEKYLVNSPEYEAGTILDIHFIVDFFNVLNSLVIYLKADTYLHEDLMQSRALLNRVEFLYIKLSLKKVSEAERNRIVAYTRNLKQLTFQIVSKVKNYIFNLCVNDNDFIKK